MTVPAYFLYLWLDGWGIVLGLGGLFFRLLRVVLGLFGVGFGEIVLVVGVG